MDIVSGEPLFSSKDNRLIRAVGWPEFSKPVENNASAT
ncbi:hypothetical protein ACHWWK_27140 [Klebsiella pneumoniae]